MRQLGKMLLAITGALCLSACGNGASLQSAGPADPAATAATAPGAVKRQLVSNEAWPAPLGDYLGSRSAYSAIRARVDRIGDPFYGPQPNSETAAQTIYTPFYLSDVQVLRGPSGTFDTVAIEGGTIGEEEVVVNGGALEVEAGTILYAVVTAPGTRAVGPAQAVVAHAFPVLANGDVFLRENILPDAAARNSKADTQYTDRRGGRYSGRTLPRDKFESAVRNN